MSSNKKLLVVLGITGQQGSSVARLFLTSPLSTTWRIRGLSRTPSKPSNDHLRAAGVDLVAADVNDPASLTTAFADADAIFSVTDFWANIDPSSTDPFPNIQAMEIEIQQGKNIIDAAAAAHAKKPLHRLVVSTLADSKTLSKGEIQHNLHFDSKSQYCQYLKSTHPALAKVTSYVHVGMYLNNAFNPDFALLKPRKAADGTYIVPLLGLENGKPIPFVYPPHDMGYFVEALINRAPGQTEMLGYCELMTNEEYAALWGKTFGVQARLQPVDYDKMKAAGAPEWLALEVHDAGVFTTKYGWAGGDPAVKSPADCGVDVSKLTSVAQFIKEQNWEL